MHAGSGSPGTESGVERAWQINRSCYVGSRRTCSQLPPQRATAEARSWSASRISQRHLPRSPRLRSGVVQTPPGVMSRGLSCRVGFLYRLRSRLGAVLPGARLASDRSARSHRRRPRRGRRSSRPQLKIVLMADRGMGMSRPPRGAPVAAGRHRVGDFAFDQLASECAVVRYLHEHACSTPLVLLPSAAPVAHCHLPAENVVSREPGIAHTYVEASLTARGGWAFTSRRPRH